MKSKLNQLLYGNTEKDRKFSKAEHDIYEDKGREDPGADIVCNECKARSYNSDRPDRPFKDTRKWRTETEEQAQ